MIKTLKKWLSFLRPKPKGARHFIDISHANERETWVQRYMNNELEDDALMKAKKELRMGKRDLTLPYKNSHRK